MPANVKTTDTYEGKSILTGLLLGLLSKARDDGFLGNLILDVQPVFDDDGEYMCCVDVTIRSGTYRVGVLDEHLITEEL